MCIRDSPEDTPAALKGIKAVMDRPEPDGAIVLGAHMEAPFLQESKAGAQLKQYFALPDEKNWEAYAGPYASIVRMITMAPEKEGALDFIRRLTDSGITVSLGHTSADAETVHAAADHGATHVTHTFNAQTPQMCIRDRRMMDGGSTNDEAGTAVDPIGADVRADHRFDAMAEVYYSRNRRDAVSYTHLVMERRSVAYLNISACGASATSCCMPSTWFMPMMRPRRLFISVSYTHLDVYKRQPLPSCGWIPPGKLCTVLMLSRPCLLYTSRCV